MNGLIGSYLGKYRIDAEIGRGGMGIVYRGYDPALRRPVAIKVLPPQLTYDAQFVQRFQQEAVLAASLRHPGIVTIHDVGEQSGTYYIVMEHLEGETLEGWLRRQGPLSAAQASRIVGQVAAALDYAHGRGVVHRDIKPANIMLGPDGRVTLMDFGLVRAAEGTSLTRSGQVMGTPEYMAPEQALGEAVDARSDVYALGVVAYKLLSGQVPFSRSTPYATTYAHIHEPPPPLRTVRGDLPAGVEAVVNKALAKRPEERFQRAGELAAALNASASGQVPVAIQGPRPTPGTDATRLMDRRAPQDQARKAVRPGWLPWVAGAALLFVVAAIAALAWGLGRSSGDEVAQEGQMLAGISAPTAIAAMTPNLPAAPPAVGTQATEVALNAPPTSAPMINRPTEPQAQPAATETTPPVTPTAEVTETAGMQAASASGGAAPPAPTPTVTEAPPARLTAAQTVNVRGGPGTNYPVIGRLTAGQSFEITGRNANGDWWEFTFEGQSGWVTTSLVETTGALDTVAVIAAPPPPPTPTRPPTCGSQPGPTFARVWDRNRIGCPTGQESGVLTAYEPFERGWMLWREDNDGHYALFSDGRFAVYWYPPSEPPNFSCPEAAAAGMPRRGFGRVWCENLDTRQRIGRALGDEVGDHRPVQTFERGFMVYVKERGTIALVYDTGAWSEVR